MSIKMKSPSYFKAFYVTGKHKRLDTFIIHLIN
ncbi:Uncharacterised protein [Legionella jordanis]|nr:Uncharacterised protein [Legionella jordanis]